jgi:hypothetical protein
VAGPPWMKLRPCLIVMAGEACPGDGPSSAMTMGQGRGLVFRRASDPRVKPVGMRGDLLAVRNGMEIASLRSQ